MNSEEEGALHSRATNLVLRAGAAVGSSDRLEGHGRTGSLIPCPRLHWHPHPCLPVH